MRVTCKHCGGSHPAFDCKKSTADVLGRRETASLALNHGKRSKAVTLAGTQALPVDTNSEHRENGGFGAFTSKNVSATTSAGMVGNEDRQPIPKRARGRPRTITDMRAYKRDKMREYRAAKKADN